MKKNLLVTLATLATGLIFLHSCNTKETAPSRGESEFVEVTVTLDEAETKTINAQEKTLWAEDDKLTAILASYSDQDYQAGYLTYKGDNTFTGRLTYPSDDNDWYLIYPYREDNVTPHKTHITVGKELEQTGSSMAHIAGPGFPLIGKALDQTKGGEIAVTMKNVLAHLVFEVTNTLDNPIVVKQLVFSTSRNISGDFVGDMTNDNIAWTAESGASKSVTLNVSEGITIAKDVTAEFHLGILPAIVSGDNMKVKIVAVYPDAPGTEIVYYKTYTSNRLFASGKNYTFNNLNVDTDHSNDPLPGLENPDEPSQPDQPGQPDDPTPSGESAYVKVTSEPTTWDGTYLIVDESSSMAFAAFSGNASSYAVNVTISNGKIAATSDVAKYAFTISDAGVKHANATSQEAYNILNSEGKYIFWSSSTLQILDTNQKTAGGGSSSDLYTYYNTLAYSSNGVQVMSSGHSSSFNKYYLGYASGAFNYDSDGESRRVQLYKLTESSTPSDPTKQNQNLSFAQSTVTRNLATASGNMDVQSVSGAHTDVTYSSTNTNVATVSGTTITIKGFGSTTITATAAESSSYNSASASYTLVINQTGGGSSTGERTYTYQTSVSAGTYLIGGYESSGSNQYSIALFPTVQSGTWESSQGTASGQYIPQRNISSGNTITFTDDSEVFNAEVELIASGSSWKIKTSAGYLVASGNYVITFTSNESSATAFTISGGSGSGYGMGTSGSEMSISSGDYYFYHSGSAQGFSIRNYQVSNIRLYKKTSEGGSTSGKQNQTLSFGLSTVTTTATVGSTMSVQTVSGNQTTPVTYSSSNSSVATVSGTNITINGFGSTIITAIAPENSTYNSGSASYTLVVNQSGGGSSTGERTYTYTAPNSLDEGTYIIAGSETNELSVALFPTVNTGSWNSQQTGQVSNGQYVPHKVYGSSNTANTITTTDSAIIGGEVELVKNGNNWRILVKANSQYLASPSAEYRISFTSSASSAANFSISSGTNGATVQTGSYYFYHSGSASGFTLRTSSTSNLRFYKLTSGGDSSGKQYQTLSFANGTETLALESASGDYQVQSVSGAQTSVTYSSSNTSVATVYGTTLTITGYGSTTITANAASSDAYYSASASYTLTVKKASQTGVYLLENEAIEDYFDRAINGSTGNKYTVDNHSSLSYVSTILNLYGTPNYTNKLRHDWPAPATVTWTQSVTASNCTLAVYYDQAYTNEEIMAVPQISNTSADIYNLIPGKTYYWVLKNGNSTVASGHFDTEGRRRMVGIGQKSNYGQNYANNCRDFGGQVTRTGKKIKYGRMYRGSNMDNTTAEQKNYLLEKLKIRLDVDLRTGNGSSSNNGNNTYNALKNNNSGVTMNDITNGDYNTYVGHTQEQYSVGSDLTNAQKMGPTLMRIMNAIHNGVNVYIHCMVGADRTGGTCLYLESLLGVEPERCDMDFELTSFSCVGSRTRNGYSPEQYYTVYNAINGTSGSTWQEKAINYCVNTLGVNREMITQFQNDMLE